MSEPANTLQCEYRRLGKTGLRISVPIVGAMSFGDTRWNKWALDEEKSLPLLKAAWDAGVNTIDTANMYSNGVSEEIIAKFMKHYTIPRENLVIMTKIHFLVDRQNPGSRVAWMPGGSNKREFVNHSGLSRTAIFNQVNASLTRLGTDYVDVLFAHMRDPNTPFEETMRALHDVVVAGKARYLGVSNVRAWHVAEMNAVAAKNGWTEFSVVQVEHSLLYRTEEVEMFAYCDYKGLGTLAYAPYMNGHLARPLGTETERAALTKGSIVEKKLRPSDEEIIRRVQQTAEKKGWKMSQVALGWSLTKVSSPIVGFNTEGRVKEAIVAGKTLTDEEIKFLEEPYEPQPHRMSV